MSAGAGAFRTFACFAGLLILSACGSGEQADRLVYQQRVNTAAQEAENSGEPLTQAEREDIRKAVQAERRPLPPSFQETIDALNEEFSHTFSSDPGGKNDFFRASVHLAYKDGVPTKVLMVRSMASADDAVGADAQLYEVTESRVVPAMGVFSVASGGTTHAIRGCGPEVLEYGVCMQIRRRDGTSTSAPRLAETPYPVEQADALLVKRMIMENAGIHASPDTADATWEVD